MHLVGSIHYIHLSFVASRLFYFLLLDTNSMYIILNLLYTHSNRHVVALGEHHFDNCSKRLIPMSKPCASTTKSPNINVTLVVDDMFQLPLVSRVWTSENSPFSTDNRKLSLRDRESLYVWTNGWKCEKLSRPSTTHIWLWVLHYHVICRTIITSSCRHWNVESVIRSSA